MFKTNRQQARLHEAFTLVELLIVLGIASIVLALAIPPLAAIRQQAFLTKCQSNVRQLGVFVTLYSCDFRSYYPTWVSDGGRVASDRAYWPQYTLQGGRLFSTVRWLRYANTAESAPIYRCPSNVIHGNGGMSNFDYIGVNSMYADPAFLNAELPIDRWKNRFGGRAQLLDNVRFPSKKVGLFEILVWHGSKVHPGTGKPSNATGPEIFTSSQPSTMWFFDGSVGELMYSNCLPGVNRSPVWYSRPIWLTASGAHGRDR